MTTHYFSFSRCVLCLSVVNEDVLSFTLDHPHYKTHGVTKRPVAAVPRISGQRLPNIAVLRSNSKCSDLELLQRDTEREQYGWMASVMFLPHRQLRDLLNTEDEEQWWDGFLRHELNGDFNEYSLAIMRRMQDHYDLRATIRDADDELLTRDVTEKVRMTLIV